MSQCEVFGAPFFVGVKAAGEHRNETHERSKQRDRRQPGRRGEVRPPDNRNEGASQTMDLEDKEIAAVRARVPSHFLPMSSKSSSPSNGVIG